jgi:hypothetical protein
MDCALLVFNPDLTMFAIMRPLFSEASLIKPILQQLSACCMHSSCVWPIGYPINKIPTIVWTDALFVRV